MLQENQNCGISFKKYAENRNRQPLSNIGRTQKGTNLKRSFLDIERIRKDRVILAAIKLPDKQIETVQESLDELATLCRSAGGEVVGDLIQARERFHPGSLFGEGKLHELKQQCLDVKARLVIYDGDLSPSQQQKLESYLDLAVIDRPALILDIFARHAKSREAKTQVELAQLQYILPRLAGHWTHLERQESAIGSRGPGETQLETDRRLVRKKIADLKKSLKKIDSDRNVQRKRRSSKINFCLIGYTNAGKSSLFNRLTGDKTLVANRLFATLDSTTRRVPLKGKSEFLLTDTVGFIRKLPHNLVASFRSTLKEANTADMLIHVVDFSAHDIEHRIDVVNEVLAEIKAGDLKRLLVFNKIDVAENLDMRRYLMAKYKGCRFVSAKTGEGLDTVIEALADACADMYTDLEARVSQKDSRAIALISKMMQITHSDCVDGDMVFRGDILKYDIPKLEHEGIKIEFISSIP
ncbi:MAG: GTPase HflX [candidate division Zixibacteria bacterium]|nr:GTPase HflX [candidate division Zixibacteria bacterium]